MNTMPHKPSALPLPVRQMDNPYTQRRRLLLTIVLLLSLLLAACGGDEPAPAAAESNAPAGEQAATDPNQIPPKEVAEKQEFGLTMEELLQAIDGAEAKIAECMNAAGFEYVAVDANTVRTAMSSDKKLPGLSEEQFYNQYGLGISTLYTGEPPQFATVETPASLGLGEKNIAIFKALSATDQVAYNQTLLGDHQDAGLAVALEREDIARTGGCTRKALEQVIPSDRLADSYTNPKDYAIDNDPRMVAAFGQYAECVKEAGYELNTPADIRPGITAKLDEITGGAPVAALSADAKAALAELQAYERAIAAASFACEEEFVTPVHDEIEQELANS